MPWRPKRPCANPARLCSGLVEVGEKCPRCGYDKGSGRAKADKAYDESRGSASSRGYNVRWRKLRLAVLASRGICEYVDDQGRRCFEPAVDVHHKIPLAQGGTDDEGNLAVYCHSCHSEYEAKHGRRWGRRATTTP
jgi:5-methylcytosine-specific restriction protein A